MTKHVIEKRLSYSAGMKVNVGNYQSVDVHVSESETVDVSAGISDEDAELLVAERYAALKERVDDRLKESLAELKGK